MRGQIVERGPDKFLVRVYLGRDAKGKRRYTSKMVHGSRKDAERERTRLLHAADAELVVVRSDETLEGFVRRWLETKRSISARTREGYEEIIDNRIAPELGHVKVTDLAPKHVGAFYRRLEERGLSPQSIQHTHSVLRQVLRWGQRTGALVRNAAEHVERPKVRRRKASILTPAQVDRFLATTQGTRHHALWVLLFTTGLRPQEAYALTWDDLRDGWLDVNKAVVKVGKKVVVGPTKTERSERRIALPQGTLKVLEGHRRAQAKAILRTPAYDREANLIFGDRFGRLLNRNTVYRSFKRALEKAGLPENVRLYDARHTHISHLLLSGRVDLKEASARAGHSTITLTADTYAHLLPEQEERMANVVEDLYSLEA